MLYDKLPRPVTTPDARVLCWARPSAGKTCLPNLWFRPKRARRVAICLHRPPLALWARQVLA